MNIFHIALTATIALLSTSTISAKNTPDHWDGQDYHNNSSCQKDIASDLLRHISFTGSEHVLDIGCGDGKITAHISHLLPKGKILGVDISPSMLDFAQSTFSKDEFSNLDFTMKNAENLGFENQFDAVLSFTALQWAKDHQVVLQNIKKSLKPQGFFGITMPLGLPDKLQQAVDEVVLDSKWSKCFSDFDTGWNFVKLQNYQKLVEEEGFTIKSIQLIKQEDVFPSVAVFKAFISQWFPYLRPLPENLKDEFMDIVLSKYTQLEPLDENGGLHFKIERLDVIANKG